jgi:hypothetical protein
VVVLNQTLVYVFFAVNGNNLDLDGIVKQFLVKFWVQNERKFLSGDKWLCDRLGIVGKQ